MIYEKLRTRNKLDLIYIENDDLLDIDDNDS